MSRSRKAHIQSLDMRAEWLRGRISDGEARGMNVSFFKQELCALEWAKPILEAHIEANRVLHEQLRRVER